MSSRVTRVAVLGAGSGGLAIAAALALKGHDVRLWNRSLEKLYHLRANNEIELCGVRQGRARIGLLTVDLHEAVRGVEVVMVVTTADAHNALAHKLASCLQDQQIILLNPGRTGGALEFARIARALSTDIRIYVAEAQSLVFACRIEEGTRVQIIGEKQYVPVAAMPATDTDYVLHRLRPLFDSFARADHVLVTSLENIGAIFHPAVIFFNVSAIERGEKFYFYQDMTPSVAEFLIAVDVERLRLGRAFALNLISIVDWIKKAYPYTHGNSLCEMMRNNPAYHNIRAPNSLNTRLLTEDIPTGLVAFYELGKAAGLCLPLIESIINIGSTLMHRNFFVEGRTLEKMGIAGKSPTEILEFVK